MGRGPATIGRYVIERELGRGGMGVVYVARDPELGRRVALKQLHAADALRDPAALARFEREALALARLNHPAIVRVHEAGQTAAGPFLVLDLVAGESLQARLNRAGALPLPEALRLGVSLADGLAHAHAAGVLHRDLKPENVLLAAEGAPRLVDFGLARDLAEARERLTRTGELLGTPAFMAPEQADGRVRDIDERTDVYGLSATLYAALTGRRPFEAAAGGVLAVLQQVLTQPPPPPSAHAPALPRELERLLLAGLAKRREDRPPSAEALRDALARVGRGPPDDAGGRLRPVRRIAALAGVAVAAVALAMSRRPAPEGAAHGDAARGSAQAHEPVAARPGPEQAQEALGALLERRGRRLTLADELDAWWETYAGAAAPELRTKGARRRLELAGAALEIVERPVSSAVWAPRPGSLLFTELSGGTPAATTLVVSRYDLEARQSRELWTTTLPHGWSTHAMLQARRGVIWGIAGARVLAPDAEGLPLEPHELGANAGGLAVAPDGQRALVSTATPHELVLIDAEQGVIDRHPAQQFARVPTFVGPALALLVFRHDSVELFDREDVSAFERLELWQVAPLRERPRARDCIVTSVVHAVAPLGPERILVACGDGVIRSYSLPDLEEREAEAIDPDDILRGEAPRRGYHRRVIALAAAPDQSRLYAIWQDPGTDARELACFDLRTREWPRPWPVSLRPGRGVARLTLSRDGRRLLVATGSRLEVWSTPP